MANGRPRRTAAVRFADPEDVRDFAAGLTQNQLECRDVGHIWKHWTAAWSGHEGCFHRVLRCSRCRTEREQRLSDKGVVLSNSYHYADGYTHAGLGRIAGDAKDLLRLASVTKQTEARPPKKDQTKRNRRRKG